MVEIMTRALSEQKGNKLYLSLYLLLTKFYSKNIQFPSERYVIHMKLYEVIQFYKSHQEI